ncbi:MAG: hypothetical protein U0163_00285 [Gemmatimonadaceae bacterium]
MIRRVSRAALVAGMLILGITIPASAQFVVYDPVNYGNALLRYYELQAQLTQLISTYLQIRTQYQLLFKQSQRLPFQLASRYLSVRTPWRPLTGTSTYGTTNPWLAAANTGLDALGAIRGATETLTAYPNIAMNTLPLDQRARLREFHDRTELQDGVASTALEAIGRLRSHELSVENTLKNLETDTYSDDADVHTQVAVLNKINAADVAGARIAKDTNYLLVSLLEQQVLDATERREAAVQGLNAHAAFLSQARPLLAASTADTTRALSSFRIP